MILVVAALLFGVVAFTAAGAIWIAIAFALLTITALALSPDEDHLDARDRNHR